MHTEVLGRQYFGFENYMFYDKYQIFVTALQNRKGYTKPSAEPI
jgi:hypothetical protein